MGTAPLGLEGTGGGLGQSSMLGGTSSFLAPSHERYRAAAAAAATQLAGYPSAAVSQRAGLGMLQGQHAAVHDASVRQDSLGLLGMKTTMRHQPQTHINPT